MSSFIINNLNTIKDLLVFKENTYYFVQVIQRKKDNPSMNKQELQKGRWFIKSKEELDLFFEDIRFLCIQYNARAYISLIPRSLKKLGEKCLLEYSKRVSSGDYRRIYSIPNKAALSDYTINTRGLLDKPRWCIDIDNRDEKFKDEISKFISEKTKLISTINTPNGFHLIIESFNPKEILEYKVKDCDYKYNNIEFTLRRDCFTILLAYKA